MPRPKTKAAEYKRLSLRLPPKLLALLQEEAESLGRPVNTHAIYLLRQALERDDQAPQPKP